MTPQEENQIVDWGKKLSEIIQVILVSTGDERSRLFDSFCRDLERLTATVQVVKDMDADPYESPAIGIGRGLWFHAIPLGKQLAPFLETLLWYARGINPLPEGIQKQLGSMQTPAELRLYVSPDCSFCPAVVPQFTPFPAASPQIELRVIDGVLFREFSQQDDIRSVPTLVLDDNFRWTGLPKLEEVAEVMVTRDPRSLGSGALERMLADKGAGRLARMMLDREEIFPAFLDLLVHTTFQVRLGAMVVMEEIAEERSSLVSKAVRAVWERFPEADDTVKGDLLYVVGMSGDRTFIPLLQEVLTGHYPEEVKESAREALEKISGIREMEEVKG